MGWGQDLPERDPPESVRQLRMSGMITPCRHARGPPGRAVQAGAAGLAQGNAGCRAYCRAEPVSGLKYRPSSPCCRETHSTLRQRMPVCRHRMLKCAVISIIRSLHSIITTERNVFISNAYAQTPAAASAGGIEGFMSSGMPIFIVMFVVMYFFMIRPQMKRQKEQKAMMDALAKGDEVITAGGILGKVIKVTDAYVTLEIADGTNVLVQKSAVSTLLPKGTIKSL
jgi:preprotein translocase subunit YajC